MTEKKISRKKFIALGAGGAAVLAGGASFLPARAIYTDKYPDVAENKKELPPNGKSVCIIGGGLSGLQCGVELAARGFQVTILEKSGSLGGKLKSWRDKNFGPDDLPIKKDPSFAGFVREHGLHAVWGFYNNLREFMGRYKFPLVDLPKGHSIYSFLDKDGTRSHLPRPTWIGPFTRIQQTLNFQNLELIEKGQGAAMMSAISHLFTFDYTDTEQREYLDSVTFAEYGRQKGMSKNVIDKFFDSIAEMAYFDNVTSCSALTIGLLMQLISGSAADMEISLFASPPDETFIVPMADYIRSRGGVIHFNSEVEKILFKDGRVQGLATQNIGPGKVRRCRICGELIYGNDNHDRCPFCGAGGENLQNLSADDKKAKNYTADYFICALDIPGARKLVYANIDELTEIAKKAPLNEDDIISIKNQDPASYFQNITKLHPKDVYIVDFWFNGSDFWKKRFASSRGTDMNFFATGFDHLGITINWSLPRETDDGKKTAMLKEYAGMDVSIIETQIAKVHLVSHLPDEEIVKKCYEELKIAIPDIPPYQSWYLNKWRNYTRYLPGDEIKRPYTQSPVDNLLFTGDLTFVPHACVFMEKTNVTAKWAVNLILEKCGMDDAKITILRSGTPSAFVKFLDLFYSV